MVEMNNVSGNNLDGSRHQEAPDVMNPDNTTALVQNVN